ncbi:ribosomal protein S5 domain 2-like protein [Rhizoclosmatium globosum]|uniref:Ribosomal protein S5 domain 2-like protein n=1 Tax=Rhizoclosmatium globosum TaxID=329046 RepID=A0A1Y2C9S5_9FUNG|nr:ribosomal protein S5 domain 2-like protein [Rhizoclosmatium globosum]|eukprot:ORY43657.1 ribosomal protein S5 domain 2-like protein [Rhizoclosmatium globosum]
MALDSKRIKGPEKSFVPLPLLVQSTPTPTPTSTKTKGRIDGRGTDEVRPLFATTRLVRQASGSAFVEVGGVKVVCAVYGPKPVPASKVQDHHSGGRISCDVRLSPFAALKRKQFMKEPAEHSLSNNLHTALLPSLLLAHLPKSQIDIHIQILQAQNPTSIPPNAFVSSLSLLLAPCITAASLALADAQIEMMDSVVGCNLGIYRNPSTQKLFWMVDCTEEEIETRSNGGGVWVGNCVVGVMPSIGKVTGLVMDGDIGDVGFVMEAVQVCVDACAKIHEVVVKKALIESAQAKE